MAGQVYRFGPENSVLIPRNRLHQIVNTGSGPMLITALFAGATVEVFDGDGEPMPLPW